MYVFTDSKGQIKDVGSTNDSTLTKVYLDEKHADFPFSGWNIAKICCYKVRVDEKGGVLEYTPYIYSKLIAAIDSLGNENSKLKSNLSKASSTLDSILVETIPALLVEIQKLQKGEKK